MTIHFYINSSFPFGMAAAKRRLCYAKGLMAAGDTVRVHCTHRCFDRNNDDDFPSKGTYEGIKYNYISGKLKRSNKILRGLDWYLLDDLRTFIYALRNINKDEIVYLYFYSIFLQILLIFASKVKGAKTVKETCEHPSALGNTNSTWHKFCKWFEYHFVMPLYDGFIPISTELEKFVNKYKSKKAHSIIIPILVEEDLFNIDFSKKVSPYNVPYIIHTGTMHEQKDSISKIIHAFASFKKKYEVPLKLVFTGPQANEKCEYIPMMEELGIREDVELLGMVSIEQVAILQHFAAMTIIYKSDNLQTRNCFPTKLGEMLMSGVPVITTSVGDAKLYLKNEGESAFIIDPDDEDRLLVVMNILLNDSCLAKQIGNSGREVARKYFNPYYQGKKLHEFFHKLV